MGADPQKVDPPRWPGGPEICTLENLPRFETWKEAEAFHEKNAPGARIIRKGVCKFCGGWHYVAKPRPPSGDSSGTGRE